MARPLPSRVVFPRTKMPPARRWAAALAVFVLGFAAGCRQTARVVPVPQSRPAPRVAPEAAAPAAEPASAPAAERAPSFSAGPANASCGRAGSSGPAAPPATWRPDVIETRWPDGTLRERRHVLRGPGGALVDHGLFTRWYLNGRKEYEARYDHGRLDGIERTWHDNGRLRTEQHYTAGVRNGPRITWDPQGRRRKEEHYRDDRPIGLWTIWDPDGEIEWQHDYGGIPTTGPASRR